MDVNFAFPDTSVRRHWWLIDDTKAWHHRPDGGDIMTLNYAINARAYVKCKYDTWIFNAFA